MNAERFDIAIIGGGPVGSSLARALAGSGLRIAVLEARKAGPLTGDGRSLALAYGSRLVLERIGAWSDALQATPITSVHVSQRGGFGRTLLHARDANVPALGYTIPYNALNNILSTIENNTDIQYIWNAAVKDLRSDADGAAIEAQIDGAPHTLHARLAVLADGARGIAAEHEAAPRERDYAQLALTAQVRTELPHGGCAYERFTPSGPIALLPLRDRYALVWVAPRAQAERLQSLDEAQFLTELQQQFGARQGRFVGLSPRAAFPLALRYAREVALPGVVRVGSAAQALHPVAAQGFNLGLRDAWALSRLIARSDTTALNGAGLARAYARERRLDRTLGIGLTDFLARVFDGDAAPLRTARGAGLWLLENAGPLRRAFTRAMLFGGAPR